MDERTAAGRLVKLYLLPDISSSFAHSVRSVGHPGAYLVQAFHSGLSANSLFGVAVGGLVNLPAAHSTTSANHLLWGPLGDTTSANFSRQLCRRSVLAISWNDGSLFRGYHGRTGNSSKSWPTLSNHSTTRLYNTNAIGAVRRTALGSRLAGSSKPNTCLPPSKVTSNAQRLA